MDHQNRETTSAPAGNPREHGFGDAFADASIQTARPSDLNATGADAIDNAGARAAAFDPEDSAALGRQETPAGLEVPAFQDACDAGERPEGTDYRHLFERERQRLKSLDGRFRKERESWREERDRLLAGKGDSGSGHDFEPSAGEELPDDQTELNEIIRREAETMVRPLLDTLQVERHVERIATAHPDWERIGSSPEFETWIDAQPGYLARSLRQVVDSGSADEVVDLLSRYKADRMATRSAEQAARDEQTRARRMLQAMAVRSRTAGPPRTRPDSSDYTGAWSEAASHGG